MVYNYVKSKSSRECMGFLEKQFRGYFEKGDKQKALQERICLYFWKEEWTT